MVFVKYQRLLILSLLLLSGCYRAYGEYGEEDERLLEQKLSEQGFDFEVFYTDNTAFLRYNVLLEQDQRLEVFSICYDVFPHSRLYRMVIQPDDSETSYFYELSVRDMRRVIEGKMSEEALLEAIESYTI